MNFKQAISRYKRTWVIGKCFKTLLWVLAITIVGVILYGLADSVWALSNASRSLINKLIIVGTSVSVLVVIYRAIKTSRAELASTADAAISNSSKTIRAAHDLTNQESISPLNDFLSKQAQDDAVGKIKAIPLQKKIPLKGIGIGILATGVMIAIGLGMRSIHPEAYDIVKQRLLHPDQDIPPYSPFDFKVTQEADSTVYGGENQVRVEISGGELEEEVVCKIRNKRTGEIDTISTFQESKTVFSKKFSNILTDIEYSFALGNARSEWKTIKVLLQPKFTQAMIKVTPPLYTKRTPQEFPLEGNEINVINGSKVELTISSNRPLSGGELIVKTDEKEVTVEAERSGSNSKQVTYSWITTGSSNISAMIKDVLDTPSAAPLEFNVVSRADLAPLAEITSPVRFVLATPNSKIPLGGYVQDDFEVDSVYLVRTLVGFRDRAKQIASTVNREQFNFDKTLDLNKIGVAADQMLEFYLEANDKNPSLLGIGTSDVVRVQIISEEEYAKRIRNKLKLNEFNARYRVLRAAINEAVKSLRQLQQTNIAQVKDPFDKQVEETSKVHQNSHNIAVRVGEDFQAFELEKSLSKTALEIAEKLLENYDQLGGMNFDDGELNNTNQIKDMVERLGALLDRAKQLEADAERLLKYGKVAEQSAIFMKLYRNQLSIASRITNIAKEIRKGVKRNAQQIVLLGETQQKNKKQLLQFAKDLKKAASELHEEDADLQGDCEVWLDQMEELNIPDPMDATTLATQVGKSHDAATQAYLAHALMKQLVEMEGNLFADMLNRRKRKKKDPAKGEDEIEKAMQQMLEALHKQNGGGGGKPGDGAGGGGGFGEGAGGGAGRRGNAGAPMYGPGRSRFNSPDTGTGRGQGLGEGRGKGKPRPKVSGNSSLKSDRKRDTESSQARRTNIPSKYKDAVKRFYSDSDQPTEAK